MAYNLELASRLRAELSMLPRLSEKNSFGGVGFMLQGNMACGVHGEDLIVRVGPDRYEAAFSQPQARPFDMTGRPMTGWIMVTPGGYETENDLKRWVAQGVEFARSLPAK